MNTKQNIIDNIIIGLSKLSTSDLYKLKETISSTIPEGWVSFKDHIPGPSSRISFFGGYEYQVKKNNGEILFASISKNQFNHDFNFIDFAKEYNLTHWLNE